MLDIFLQQSPTVSPSPSPPSGDAGGFVGFMWIEYLIPLFGPLIVVGLLLGVGTLSNERGWQLSPWTAVGVPVAVSLAELVPLVYSTGLSWVMTHGRPMAYLGFAVVTGAAIVGGGAIKHEHWGYGIIAGALGVGAFVMAFLASDIPGTIDIALGYTFVGVPVGYVTVRPQASVTEPAVTADEPS